jgi:hypothetical protein
MPSPDSSIERTSSSRLRLLAAAAHVNVRRHRTPSAPTDRRTCQVRTITAASGLPLRRMMSKRCCLRYQAVTCRT